MNDPIPFPETEQIPVLQSHDGVITQAALQVDNDT
jgi:hypothetical protein